MDLEFNSSISKRERGRFPIEKEGKALHTDKVT
jgi:hypothetical protein